MILRWTGWGPAMPTGSVHLHSCIPRSNEADPQGTGLEAQPLFQRGSAELHPCVLAVHKKDKGLRGLGAQRAEGHSQGPLCLANVLRP